MVNNQERLSVEVTLKCNYLVCRGRTPEWYNKSYGHICALYLTRIRGSFKHNTEGPESKVWVLLCLLKYGIFSDLTYQLSKNILSFHYNGLAINQFCTECRKVPFVNDVCWYNNCMTSHKYCKGEYTKKIWTQVWYINSRSSKMAKVMCTEIYIVKRNKFYIIILV